MESVQQHLEFITGSLKDSLDYRVAVDGWLRYPVDQREQSHSDEPDASDTDSQPWQSVLNIYDAADGALASQNDVSPLLSKLLSKSDIELLLPSLRSMLSSTASNDIISEELAELLGFDEIELIVALLENRSQVSEELEHYSSNNHEHSIASRVRSHQPNDYSLSSQEARKRIQKQLQENSSRPLFTGVAQDAHEVLPHVYTSSSIAQGNILSHLGSKYMLPMGTERHHYEEYEEVIIPPARPVPQRMSERLIPVSELDSIAKGSFPGYTSLNRIQSIVYPVAYQSNENMLVCAPTGAGKTDVAMLSILRVLSQHRSDSSLKHPLKDTVLKQQFKIIYVAPMKALASEITRKLGKRLKWLDISVRELTGDMQLTKSEINQTQIIVTTPEKWDVVTRKPTGEGELAAKLKLLIIDEIHLLNDERGAVIEAIVARTLRQVESSQSVIRIVGLSATLPNYLDVAEFLSVSKYSGLFYFDSSFRPIPLEQHFLGVKGKPNSPQWRKNLDKVTFDKVVSLVRQGHQVMVFVHARKETVKTALALKEAATIDGTLDDFSCADHPQWELFHRRLGESRNKEMKQLFDDGFGIHHAGMLREDRNKMEMMFDAKAIKVLCCTATLAWGVNLPAHAVIIKGTTIYDSSKGAFVDLSVLDVLQVFGRAGRPGLQTRGEGYICTGEEKLAHYLEAVTAQNPIESQFRAGIIDALNAEISLGTVSNTSEAVQWLGYTYLFVRMRKKPVQYGITVNELLDDPQLQNKRMELVVIAARRLVQARMILFEESSGAFTITDIGRIAARYYIKYTSIEIFNKEFRSKMTEADVLAMLSMSTEFDQIQTRESEMNELEHLMNDTPCAVKGGTDTSQGKVNILLQGYISRQLLEDFALVSDTAYIAQNSGRIIRALLEIAMSKKWAHVSAVLIGMSKAIENRLWPFDQPLRQFSLKPDVLYMLEQWADELSPGELASMPAADIGKLIHLNEHQGFAVVNAAKQFPKAQIEYNLRPLGSDVLKMVVHVHRAFNWNPAIHGTVEPFWVWVEDNDGINILQLSQLTFRQSTDVIHVDFVISIPDGKPPSSVTVRFLSDRWMGSEDEVSVALDSVIMPAPSLPSANNLDLPFLSVSACKPQVLEDAFASRLRNFNAMQTQVFWSLVSTRQHTLVSSPTGSGKTTMAQIAIWSTLLNSISTSWVLVITPRQSITMEYLSELQPIGDLLHMNVFTVSRTGAFSPPTRKSVFVATSSQVLNIISQPGEKSPFTGLSMVVCDNLELLDPEYELSVSLLKSVTQTSPVRFIGFTNSINDPSDLANWLDVDSFNLHDFRPRDREQALTVATQTFTIPQSASLFKAMIKSTHLAVRSITKSGSTLIFVPSAGQCRTVARDLITHCSLVEGTAGGYLPGTVSEDHLEEYLVRLRDRSLVEFVSRGVGIFSEGMVKRDRELILGLHAEGVIPVLIVPRESCWTIQTRVAGVVVMGTQYVHVDGEGSERQIRDYELIELVRMQGRAVRHSGSGFFYLFCQPEAKDTISRFLNDGLPLESQLMETTALRDLLQERRGDGNFQKQQAMDLLTFTFLARRLVSNPMYYDAEPSKPLQYSLSRIVDSLGL